MFTLHGQRPLHPLPSGGLVPLAPLRELLLRLFAPLLLSLSRTPLLLLTRHLRSPPLRRAGRRAPEQQLQAVLAEGLQQEYFKDRGRRADGVLVEFTDIDYVELSF
ncbi:hypothetical protein ACFYWN_33960 [Streptomyces sp. NPDC002917]|uniref:hypothetical protein n=1 Tax=unclassified Streptomyces TaxID=2593676 RepID=UPI00368FB4A5